MTDGHGLSATDADLGSVVGGRLSQIKRWLDALPTSNLEAAAERLLLVCRDVLHSERIREQQLIVLRLLQPRISQLLMAISRRYEQTPMTARHDVQLFRLVEALQIAQCRAWSLALQTQLVENRQYALPDHALQRLVFDALRTQFERLQYHFSLYLPAPDGEWRGSHQLYALAREYGFEHDRIRYLGGDGTIHQLYVKTVLLGAVNPYRLLPGEVCRLPALFDGWASYVRLEEADRTEAVAPDSMWIDLTSDAPPGSDRPVTSEGQCLVMTIADLKRVMEATFVQMHRAPGGNHPMAMIGRRAQRDLLMRLTKPWWRRLARRATRLASSGQLELLTGLSRCHSLYQRVTRRQHGGAAVFAAELSSELTLVSHERYSHTGVQQTLPASSFHAGRDIWAPSNLIEPLNSESYGVVRDAEQGAQAEQLDHSECGLRLRLLHAHDSGLRVGELVALRQVEYGRNQTWSLAVVRWLRAAGAGQASGGLAGVEWLSSRVLAVEVRAVSGAGMGGASTRALVLEAESELPSAGRVVAAAGIYDVGTVLSLVGVKARLQLTLQRVVDSTDTFGCYEFKLT